MPTSPPTWGFNFAEDFLLVDGLESVELARQLADGTYGAAVTVRAVRESPNRKTSAGLMEGADVVFHLHGPDVGAAGVHRGDRITDSEGNSWDATGATLAGVLDQWRVACVQLPAGA
jgi:electron transfer flavoprotein alpha/beta subunit